MQKPAQSVYLSQELCKFNLTNTCQRSSGCNFSHDTHEFPCKNLHSMGRCSKGDKCLFKHDILNEQEIQKFMQENEDLLSKVLKDTGTTILSDYFTNYLKDKRKKEIEAAQPKNAMLPPSLIGQQSMDSKMDAQKSLNQPSTQSFKDTSGQAKSGQMTNQNDKLQGSKGPIP